MYQHLHPDAQRGAKKPFCFKVDALLAPTAMTTHIITELSL